MPSNKKKKAATKSKKICARCSEPSTVRINGVSFCQDHAQSSLQAHDGSHKVVKMKALDPNLDLRTVLAKAGLT